MAWRENTAAVKLNPNTSAQCVHCSSVLQFGGFELHRWFSCDLSAAVVFVVAGLG